MGHLQPSRVTSRVTSSQKWRTSSPPATFVRNRVLYVKFMPNIQRAQRALSPCRSENHIQNHIHAKFRGLKSHLITSNSHIRAKFSGQSHPSGHIRNHIRTKSSHFHQEPTLARGRPGPPKAPRGSLGPGAASLDEPGLSRLPDRAWMVALASPTTYEGDRTLGGSWR